MSPAVEPISLGHLALVFLPVLIVMVIQFRWALPVRSTAYGIVRMLLQLLLVGYVLVYLFESDNAWIVCAVIFVMIMISSWVGTLYSFKLISTSICLISYALIHQKQVGLSTTDLLAALTLLALDIIFMPWSSRAVSNLDYISHWSLEL